MRLNCIDHYQATVSEFDPPVPHEDGTFQKRDRPKVPIIRIFGSTETGQKVCVHVHGAFPYIYIEYSGPLASEQVGRAIRSLHLSIDHALALSYRRNAYDGKTAFVAHVSLVKGVPFYGYHVGYRFFFKIYLLNSLYVTRLVDLLLQGAILKRPLQPYESHLQYVPQWMCDYNLYGCDYMDCRKYKFRSPIPDYLELSDISHRWHNRSISPDYVSDPSVLPKQSHCSLEVDVCVQDILNRLQIQERPLHHDFTEMLKPVVSNERLVPSMAALWQDETRRRKKRLAVLDTAGSPFGSEELVSMSADLRNQSNAGWIHEQEYREMVSRLAAEERRQAGNKATTIDSVVLKKAFENQIQTALESVEELYPEKLQARSSFHDVPSADDNDNEVQVNEHAAMSFSIDEETHFDSHNPADDPFSAFENVNVDEDIAGNLEERELIDIDLQRHLRPKSNPQDQRVSDSCSIEYSDSSPSHDVVSASHDSGQSRKTVSAKTTCYDSNGIKSAYKSPHDQVADSEPAKKKLRFREQDKEHLSCEDTFETSSEIAGSRKREESAKNSNKRAVRFKSDHVKLNFDSSPKTALARDGAETKRLNFPVVKDPRDPLTVLRFSQESNYSSKVVSQSSQGALKSSASKGAPSSAGQGDGKDSFSQPRTMSFLSYLSSSLVSGAQVQTMAGHIHAAFDIPLDRTVYCIRSAPLTRSEVSSTLKETGRPTVIYQQAYYSDENDIPDRYREYAGREFRLGSNSVHFLPPFDPSGESPGMFGDRDLVSIDRELQRKLDENLRSSCSFRTWEFAPVPPSRSEVLSWLQNTQSATSDPQQTAKKPEQGRFNPNVLSQIEGPTQKNDYGFKYSQKGKSTSLEYQTQYMSTMSLEVHVNTRGVLSPNPEVDEVTAIFWCVQSEDEDVDANGTLPNSRIGMLFHGTGSRPEMKVEKALNIDLKHEPTELDLLIGLVDLVRLFDPDILTGYEVHNSSWGYLIERARKKYDYDLCDELSRVRSQAHGRFVKDNDRWGFNHTSSIQVTGRHMINIWRAMRSELNLLQYTMENVAFHLLHRRIPHYSFQDLTAWYTSGKPRDLLKVVDYFISRAQMNLEILDSNELIPRTSEQARLLGIDFFSVFSRGSQFKVESLMFRIAKPENFILISPSRKQVGGQNALECLPLVMEPQSDFYTSPLLVLDFQSLYPSVMIAYNYCYSTFLGRASPWRGRDKMGFLDYRRQAGVLELLRDQINIAPNGMIYAKPEVRKSLLAKMLTEILETRVMVKTGMKIDKDDKILQRLLNNRQLALKLIANVTYGYTSASFSGRMPCSEIADSIVQTGRETLERAIAFIHSVERWGAEVVYGDTDSLFVYLKGRTRDEAFDIGEEIANAVTEMNPRPVKLKFEKVYHPCVLLAKKRYVGFKYEHRAQKEPEFDAKGIETVRRDGTPAEQKIEEKALKILFRTADLSQVKSYFQKQCSKIMQRKVSIQDFCFAKEVRLGTYSEKGLLPPGALISTKRMLEDPRLEPQYGERVPYVVITGAPGSRLADRCVPPETLLHDAQLELDAEYYINKNIIPPLERIFNLVGANVRQWYEEMPKVQRIRRIEGATGKDARKTLESYMKSSVCIVCRTRLVDTDEPVCSTCMQQAHISLFTLKSRLRQAEKRVLNLQDVCRSCMGVPFGDEIKCDSKDCPVFYSRTRDMAHWRHTKAVLGPVVRLLQDKPESETY